MSRKNIEMILDIHQAAIKPLYDVLDGITNEQLNWQPAPDSRSINGIVCHLIRVDNSFLKKLDQKTTVEDPKNGTALEVLNSLKEVHLQIENLVKSCKDDNELFSKSTAKDAKENDTINEHILHSCQHNLYHLSQIIYLRRALDRNWESPIKGWDKATRVIAGYLKQNSMGEITVAIKN